MAAPAAYPYIMCGWRKPGRTGIISATKSAELAFSLKHLGDPAGNPQVEGVEGATRVSRSLRITLCATTRTLQPVAIRLNGHELWSGIHEGGPFQVFSFLVPPAQLAARNRLSFLSPTDSAMVRLEPGQSTPGIRLKWVQVSEATASEPD